MRDHRSSEGKREEVGSAMWRDRLRVMVRVGGWVLHCYGTFLITCECRIYLMHHSFLTKRKKRKAMIWAEMRRGEASQPRQEGEGGGGRKSSVGGSPLTHPTLAGEIDVRVSSLRGLKGGMDGAWGRGSGK